MAFAPAPTVTLAPRVSEETLPETRGIYLVHSKGFSAETIRREMELAAHAGFNLVVFPVYVNGYTFFPCETARSIKLEPISPLFKKWNPLEAALEAAHENGLSFWAFARPYNFHPRYSSTAHKLLKKKPEWAIAPHPDMKHSPARRRGQYIACPVNPEYRRYLADLLGELVGGYPIDGLVLNYTGYGLREGSLETHPFCFCEACRESFAEDRKGNLVALAAEPDGLERVRQWQSRASTVSLEYLRHRVMKFRRTLRLVCRVQPQWRNAVSALGPDLYARYCINWNRMLSSGAVESLIIDHDDEIAPELFSSRLVTDLSELHHDALVLPEVLVRDPQQIAAAQEAVHRYSATGFIADFAQPLDEATADFIRERYFSTPAVMADVSPLHSVAFLLRRVQSRHEDNPLIADFMRDFLRMIDKARRDGVTYDVLQIIFDNLKGLQNAIRRRRLGDYPIPEATMRDIGLARKITRLAILDVRS